MKNAASILLLFILVLQSGGMLITFNIRQIFVHNEMSEMLENGATIFEKIRITENEFLKGRVNSHEILYSGKMYDIKSSRAVDGIIELIVINDTDEANILRKIKSLIDGTGLPGNKVSNQLHHLVSLIYISNFSEDLEVKPSYSVRAFCQIDSDIVNPSIEILSPPPEYV